jgi:hypothetical protein
MTAFRQTTTAFFEVKALTMKRRRTPTDGDLWEAGCSTTMTISMTMTMTPLMTRPMIAATSKTTATATKTKTG